MSAFAASVPCGYAPAVRNNPKPVMQPWLSVVIPAVNEARALPATLAPARFVGCSCELIVVDGGSSDDTVAVARALGAKVFPGPQHRARQMNLGAREATGAILLFLHADTILPIGALPILRAAMADAAIVGGGFARRYDSPSLVLRTTCGLAQWRNRLLGWHLGDQAMFVRREIFEQLGGFLEVDRFEDLDFSRRLKRRGRLATLRPAVVSSARRFARSGAALTTARDFLLTLRYLVAGPPLAGASFARTPELYARRKGV